MGKGTSPMGGSGATTGKVTPSDARNIIENGTSYGDYFILENGQIWAKNGDGNFQALGGEITETPSQMANRIDFLGKKVDFQKAGGEISFKDLGKNEKAIILKKKPKGLALAAYTTTKNGYDIYFVGSGKSKKRIRHIAVPSEKE